MEAIEIGLRHFINKGDVILIHSNILPILYKHAEKEDDIQKVTNKFIDILIDIVTEEGTILLPTFNWDFCKGKAFSYKKTKSKVGSLTNVALKRADFKRTKHPIYSFTIWGNFKNYLCSLDTKNSYGKDSPFGFLHEQNGKILLINVDYQSSFTFAHYVEEQLNVGYRYHKDFSAGYIDEEGNESKKTYDIFVRDLDRGVTTWVNPMGKILEDEEIAQVFVIEGNTFVVMKAKDAFDRIKIELQRNPYLMIKWAKYNDYSIGQQMHDLMRRLFYIPRSITGSGNRKTLKILKEYIPELNIQEIPTGKKVLDWQIPKEWSVKEAHILTPIGSKICDFKECNLHLLNYSEPVDKEVSYKELTEHLHYCEELPNAIPYLTSYYEKVWGFCISYNQLRDLHKKGKYRAVISSELKDGSLTFADVVLPGKVKDEVLLSCYICHPSMANDSLSGVVLNAFLFRYLKKLQDRYFTYRLVFVPETIGAIAYLSLNGEHLKKYTKYGLVLTCVGDEGKFHYKKTRAGDKEIDKILEHILRHSKFDYEILEFFPTGSDERQYCSLGFNLPVGSLLKSVYARFDEYHTSLDNLEFVTPKGLEESYEIYTQVIDAIEHNHYYVNTKPYGEPFLTKYDLSSTVGSKKKLDISTVKILWILNLSDGKHSLVDIANKSQFPILEMTQTAERLEKVGLIKKTNSNS